MERRGEERGGVERRGEERGGVEMINSVHTYVKMYRCNKIHTMYVLYKWMCCVRNTHTNFGASSYALM